MGSRRASGRRATTGRITTIQADIRGARLPDGEFDIVLAAALLHHLRADEEWREVFTAFHRALRPGGSVWVFDDRMYFDQVYVPVLAALGVSRQELRKAA